MPEPNYGEPCWVRTSDLLPMYALKTAEILHFCRYTSVHSVAVEWSETSGNSGKRIIAFIVKRTRSVRT